MARRVTLGATLVVVAQVAACGSSEHRPAATQTSAVPGGCGHTELRRGVPPGWARPAFADSSSAIGTFASGINREALAYPPAHLRAGHPRNPANKVLWIVHPPRGSHLLIRAHPVGRAHPVVTVRRPANSGPGPIYPSYVDVPSEGCWRMTLRWAGGTDSVDLAYKPRRE